MVDLTALPWSKETVPGHPQIAPTLSVPGKCGDFDYTREWLQPSTAVREWSARFLDGAEFEWIEEGGYIDGRMGVTFGWERDMDDHPHFAPGDYIVVNIELAETVPHGSWAIEAVSSWADSLPV